MATGLVLLAMGLKDEAWMVSWLGTPTFLVSLMLYQAIKDPLNRWPGKSWFIRLGKVMFHER